MEGKPFGRYRLVELLGRGGMGEVWRAVDTAANNRKVAIKLLPERFACDATFVERFRREAEAAAQLNNKHIIPIHNYGEIDGQLYVEMRLIEGRNLEAVLVDGPLPVDRAVQITEQVAKALQAAHRAGLVHRDVKPSNVLIDEDGDAYLIDFGIALGTEQSSLTQTGMMVGSWHYMSPERFRGNDIDARADVYALTCVLYECLTGDRPFPGDTLENQVTGHLTNPPPHPSTTRPQVPAAFDDVIATGMAKNVDERYSGAAELAVAARAAMEYSDAWKSPHSAPTVLAPTMLAPTATQRGWSPKTKKLVWSGSVIAVVIAICLTIFVGKEISGGHTATTPATTPASASITNTTAVAAPEPGLHIQVVGFTQVGNALSVRLRNPNPDVGLVRSPFALTLLSKAGSTLATVGQDGVPGEVANTIYQLPPGGEFGLDVFVPNGKTVASVRLTILGEWLQWNTVKSSQVTVTDAAVLPDSGFSGPSATGHLKLDKGGPLNVVVIAFIKTSAGTVVSRLNLDCVRAGQQRPFQTSTHANARGPYSLDKVVAYPVAVKGAGPQLDPQC